MFRAIFYLLLMVVVITVVKSIIGVVLKGVSVVMNPGSGTQGTGARPSNQVPLTGELKKDPVCGTYIAAATAIKEKVGGETFHFCSQQCRDKYVASLAR